ncbi:MAG: hypothetical protein Hyperionvirus43_2 [Hyperionvirus sp.]|uniref:Uncharacterized protein n=1 Tax=Hyperionvirus sp. TaxID=2487770 RepID=A0A3G5AHF7_9VIRU|nr:MAG: hypothetical protein Hyperionvirus43_2 [Hyperionvirus sp.]
MVEYMIDIGILEFLLVVLICFVVFVCLKRRQPPVSVGVPVDKFTVEKVVEGNKIAKRRVRKRVMTKPKREKEISLNPVFEQMQFHNDYRDTLSAFNDIARQKVIFNEGDLPTECVDVDVDDDEVIFLVEEFIETLNEDVLNNVGDQRDANTGWDEPIVEKKTVSGWEKQRIELGLPVSLYQDPASRDIVHLLKIDAAEKFTTASEIKYQIVIIIQKANVADQMVVKISFVFSDPKNVTIEEINVVGYLTNDELVKDDFYNFKSLDHGLGITDNKLVVEELTKKYKNKYIDDQVFADTLKDELVMF